MHSLVSELGDIRWKEIAQEMPNDSHIQFLHCWTRVLMPGGVKGAWSAEEDQIITQWAAECGNISWTKCAINARPQWQAAQREVEQ